MQKLAVLVVDDDPILLMDMAQSLTNAGMVVFEARNAAQALEVLAMQPSVRMTITDVDMREWGRERLPVGASHRGSMARRRLADRLRPKPT